MTADSKDRKRLRKAAELLILKLSPIAEDSPIKCRTQLKRTTTNTDGWIYVVATMRRQGLRLELWLDRYPATKQRRFYYGFASHNRNSIRQLIRKAPDRLKPIRELTIKNTVHPDGVYLISPPLKRDEYLQPIYENYYNRYLFFGYYDPAPNPNVKSDRQIVSRAVALFSEMLQALTTDQPEREEGGIYQSVENRRVVRQHISRERSSVLAEERKIRDGYKCQICGMTFEKVYGAIGQEFAEAHHRIPLSRLKGKVHTTINDLVTVCSNCHRMLHKMKGQSSDAAELRRRIRRLKR